jgi:hypothetical protein
MEVMVTKQCWKLDGEIDSTTRLGPSSANHMVWGRRSDEPLAYLAQGTVPISLWIQTTVTTSMLAYLAQHIFI